MTTKDKIEWLKTHRWAEWVSTRQKVAAELSDAQTMFCCCGALATGLHETRCRRFNKEIDFSTCKTLEHLLPKQ